MHATRIGIASISLNTFPGVLANDSIDLSVDKGKILALLGENGAGKTTLMNILYGLYKPDEGQIFINGEEVAIHGPNDAIAHGIGMVHQHFMLIPVMTATENVMLGVKSDQERDFPGQRHGRETYSRDLEAI